MILYSFESSSTVPQNSIAISAFIPPGMVLTNESALEKKRV